MSMHVNQHSLLMGQVWSNQMPTCAGQWRIGVLRLAGCCYVLPEDDCVSQLLWASGPARS